ncbi:MAG: MFS transporter, partial [Candidatus Gribaldobacteria bacterium]|nr:MFS transporter [Candidatus Gribaldobacteria bacterium]
SFGGGLFLPVFAIFSQQVGGDIADAGIAAAIFLLATSFLEWPVGKLLDKYKEKWFIVIDYFLEALVFLGYIFVVNKWQLFGLQVLLGLANAIGNPAWESMFDKHTPNKRSGSSWASSYLYSGCFAALGIIIGTFLIDGFGFKIVFVIGSIFSAVAGTIALVSIKNKN